MLAVIDLTHLWVQGACQGILLYGMKTICIFLAEELDAKLLNNTSGYVYLYLYSIASSIMIGLESKLSFSFNDYSS